MTRQIWLRALLAGPGALAGAALVVLVMPLWVPAGAAKIDHLVVPVILFPLIWAALLFWAMLMRSVARGTVAFALLIGSHAAVLTAHLVSS